MAHKNRDISKGVESIIGRLSEEVRRRSESPLVNAMIPMLRQMDAELKGFSNLTGNTKNSLAVALYLDGKLIGHVYNTGDIGTKRPLRMTLKNGDVYDLPETWDGNALSSPILAKGGGVKRDWIGDRNYWADEEAVAFLERKAPSKRGYAYIFVSSVEYAKYLEAKGTANVLTNWHDELASRGADVGPMR